MAKVTGPLMAFSARGTIAKTATYASWRGVAYARQRVDPANPQSVEQTATRGVFGWASDLWKSAPALLVAPSNTAASGQPKTGRNILMGELIKSLRGKSDLADFIASPGANGGPPAETVAAVGGATGEIDVSATAPTPPTGWTLESLVAVAIKDQDPSQAFAGPVVAAEDDATQSAVTLTGLDAGEAYAVSAWLRWAKPDGRKAYSVSETSIVTAGA